MSIGDNPYIAISKLMQSSNNDNINGIKTGEVLSLAPIKIKCGAMELDSDDLIILKGTRSLLNIGDIIILLPSFDGQDYYVLGAVE